MAREEWKTIYRWLASLKRRTMVLEAAKIFTDNSGVPAISSLHHPTLFGQSGASALRFDTPYPDDFFPALRFLRAGFFFAVLATSLLVALVWRFQDAANSFTSSGFSFARLLASARSVSRL